MSADRDATGPTGRDVLKGGPGRDYEVGDNYALGTAQGARPDTLYSNGGNGDVIIGDDASFGDGDAIGGAADTTYGEQDNDLVVGDSYSPRGSAIGGGN